jgi:hypothetical protein
MGLGFAHECFQKAADIDRFFLNGQWIRAKRIFLQGIDIDGHALTDRIDEGDTDDTDGAGKCGEGCASFLGNQIF